MRIIITGGSGFIGQHLTAALLADNHHVTIADLRPPQHDVNFVQIDLTQQELPKKIIRATDSIIHLAGQNIFGRWNKKIKNDIRHSRIQGTRHLVTALKKSQRRPSVLISASAVGIYGDRGEELLTESSPPGTDFLAHVCRDWEESARQAQALGLRTVQIRTAPVLGHGGILRTMMPIYRLGLGGPIGNGQQWFPWIHIKDIVNTYLFALTHTSLNGPLNACSPQAVRNKDFSQALAATLKRPAVLRVPPWALKLRFGDLAAIIISSQKVSPQKLTDAGFKFSFPNLSDALKDIIT